MSTDRIRIDLTKEQREQIKRESGHEVESIDLGVQELEQRVAPVSFNFTKVNWTYTTTDA
jgi:type VI protein secretion system component Hcp